MNSTLWSYWNAGIQNSLLSGWGLFTPIRIYPTMSHVNITLRNSLIFIEDSRIQPQCTRNSLSFNCLYSADLLCWSYWSIYIDRLRYRHVDIFRSGLLRYNLFAAQFTLFSVQFDEFLTNVYSSFVPPPKSRYSYTPPPKFPHDCFSNTSLHPSLWWHRSAV